MRPIVRVLVASCGGWTSGRRVLVLFLAGLYLSSDISRAEPSFRTPFVPLGFGLADGISIGDLNGDGRTDLVLSISNWAYAEALPGTVAVLLARDDGSFERTTELETDRSPLEAVIVDLNLDHIPDLVVGHWDFGRAIAVFLGHGGGGFNPAVYVDGITGSLATADLDGDGAPDVAVARSGLSILFGNGAGGFRQRVDLDTDRTPTLVQVADLDADGRLDLVTANGTQGTISVFHATGSGAFSAITDRAIPGTPTGLEVLDVNGDTRLDVVTTTDHDSLAVLLGNGDSTFGARRDAQTASLPADVVAGDANGDGHVDLAVVNYRSATVSSFVGRGDGRFLARVDAPAGYGGGSIVMTDLTGDHLVDVLVNSGSGALLAGHGDGTFGHDTDFATGDVPSSAAIGDLNEDGAPDVAIANQRDDTVSILLGRGDGTLAPRTDLAGGYGPRFVVIGDLNRDGHVDLAVAEADEFHGGRSHSVGVFLGRGDGTFGARSEFDAGASPYSVAVADLNGDGKLDIAAPSVKSGVVLVLLGNGNGTFGPPASFGAGRWPKAVAIADFDADGRLDLAVANTHYGGTAERTIPILRSRGDGTFETKNDLHIGFDPADVATADLDSDGRADLVAGGDGTPLVLLGRGDGTFTPASVTGAVGQSPSVAVADVDADGRLDVVAASPYYYLGTVSVLIGRGGGAFGPPSRFASGAAPHFVVAGDLNSDGLPDLVTLNSPVNTGSVLLNETRATPIAIQDLSAVAFGGSVRISWRLDATARRDILDVGVQRAELTTEPFIDLTPKKLEPQPSMSFEDAGIEPGRDYRYRLEVQWRDGQRWFSKPVQVRVDGTRHPPTILYTPLVPTGGGPVEIRYAIAPPRQAVRLAVYDVRGRLLWARSPGMLEPGDHVELWDRRTASGSRVQRGIYLVCLDAGRNRAATKLAILRP